MPIVYIKFPGRSFVHFFYLLISLTGFMVAPLSVLAQLINQPAFLCATESLSLADRRALEAEAAVALRLKQASGASFTSLTYIPIRPHIIRKTDGTGGYTMASLNNVMALTNKYYLQNGNGIQFYFAGTTPDYIDNDDLYNQYRQNIDDATVAPRDVNNALNQYYIHKFDNLNLGGYARFPSNDVASTRTIILDENFDDDMGNRLVPHELGHTFNLLHTFEPFYGYERVTRGTGANCSTAGDLVCDTPADPYGRYTGATNTCISGCPPSYTCSFTDEQGNLYTPSPTNIMSYYFPCVHDFTPGQYDRIQAGLAMRQAHTAYTLNAPSTTMTAPSNVQANVSGGAIVISWQDNASNEMGYFIERSTLPAAGFIPIGGVAPGVTTFVDRSFSPRTQYYYRIKASNTTTGSISVTATIVAPDCRPSFTSDGCNFAINITDVTVNGTVLSQNSGCSPSSSGYYTAFTAVSSTITAGQSATFTIGKGTFNTMGAAIWVDLNNNNIFETSERLYQMPTTNTSATFSGAMYIPSGTIASTVAMRVVAAYNVIPNDPCGSYGYGETEDYRLVIRAACSTPVASLSGTTTITSGQTATLTASLNGTPPLSLTINASSGSPITFTGIVASPFSFTVAPTVSTTYVLERVANDCGTGTVNGTAVVTVNACTRMYTLKTGAWNDPTVWSCNHLPTEVDLVELGHLVTIPPSYVARALQVKYTTGGWVYLDPTAKLRLGP